jgi:hypothetical protein
VYRSHDCNWITFNKNKNGQNQKSWFDQDCKFARQKYRKSKRRYKLNNTIRNRSIKIDDEKGYKKVMDEKYKKFTVKKFPMI